MGSKVRNAISKRRPKQNIIAMILKNAKQHSAAKGGSGSHTTTSTGSTHGGAHRSRSKSGERTSSEGGKDVSRHYHGSKRGILQSAVELTRRSKRSSSRARGRRGKKVPFVKGQKAFYRSAKGIAKVTVVGIHHDSKLEPYYTIKLKDGKEKQTDGKHLTPIQEEAKEGKEKKKDAADKRGSRSKSRGRGGKDVAGSVNEMTDPLSESEVEEEVIDYTEEGDEDDERFDKGDESEADEEEEFIDYTDAGDGGGDDVAIVDQKFDIDQDAYYRSPEGPVSKVKILSYGDRFGYSVAMPDGSRKDGVPQSTLATLMELSSKELSSLMKERNRRGKERHHRRDHAASRASTDAHGESGAATEEGEGELRSVENTPSSEAGSALSSSHGDVLSGSGSRASAKSRAGSQGSNANKAAPSLPPSVQRVEAKTESGGTKMVPLYEAGMAVHYKNAAGTSKAEILDVHLDDLLEPYYSIRLEDGREKQTDNAHIVFLAGDGHPAMEEGEEEGSEGDEHEEINKEESGTEDAPEEEKVQPKEPRTRRRHSVSSSRSNSRDPQPRPRSRSTSVDPIGTGARRRDSMRDSSSRRDSLRGSLNKQLEYNERMRDSLKRMVEEQLQKEELNPEHLTKKHGLDGDSPDRSGPEPAQESSAQDEFNGETEAAKADEPAKKAQDPMSASEANLTIASPVDAPVVMPNHFAMDDEVLYTSSKGQQCQAVVTKLHRDKKNRPYYVIRLPDGKEKSVYGHRLRPNVRGHEDRDGETPTRSRSRSRGASSRDPSRSSSKASKSRGRSASKAGRSGYRRSESADSARSNAGSSNAGGSNAGSEGGQTMLSNSSRRSMASRERSERRTGRRHGSEPLRASRRERSPSAARSERRAIDPQDISDSRKSKRSRSQSVRRSKSIAHASERPEASSRKRSTSRAPSEESSRAGSKGSSSMRARLKLKSRGRSVSRPRVPVGEEEWEEDEGTATTKSLSKLRSFRKNFASMRKH